MKSKEPQEVESATERFIEQTEVFSREPIVLDKNEIGGRWWKYHEETDRSRNLQIIDFTDFDDLNKRQVLQEIMLYAVTGGIGWADKDNRLAVTSYGCLIGHLWSCRLIYNWWSSKASELSLSSFSRDDIVRLCRHVLENNRGKDKKPLAGVLKKLRATINAANRFYSNCSITDGFVYPISEHLRRDIAEPLLKPHSISYEDWVTNESYKCIPIEIGLTLLLEAIDVIRSRDTRILLAIFNAYRHSPLTSNGRNAIFLGLKRFREYQITGFFSLNIKIESLKSLQAFGEKFDELGMSDVKVLPWSNFKELTNHCRLVRAACNMLLHLVAGNRVHEIAGYQIGQWSKDSKGTWWYRSKEWKVNKGCNAERSVDPIGAESAEVLTQMSFLDSNEPRPLLNGSFLTGALNLARQQNGLSFKHPWPDSRAKKQMINKSLRNWFSDFYRSHLVKLHPRMGEKHPNSNPHEARYFWVDVALRWIDPKYCDVIGQIRENLRHSSPDMVYSYTDGKRSQDIQRDAQARYMHEILQRIIKKDPNDTWYGSAAKRILNEAVSIEVKSLDALDEFAEAQGELYSRFIFWEWGICAVPIGEEAKGNCSDSATGIPNLVETDRKMQPEVCFGCIHQMVHKGFRNKIERIGITCQQRGEALQKLNPTLANTLGFKPAKKARILLKEFDS
ncbi:hypothetical protein [Paraglaciecola sp. 25GB23A]|uniref:hypothetical protein n=1 Tax=Paraglaciecola sp. 25GB23A TaxID=3156068 RepID=UPI0032AFDD2D